MKRYTCALLVILLLLSAVCAHASDAPASQFGFSIWPYRQKNPLCNPQETATAAPSPAATPALQASMPPRATQQPSLLPTKAPLPQPTAQATAQPASTPSVSTGDYTTLSVAAQEQKLLNLLNQDRQAHGLPPLTLDPQLSRLARLKSQDMNDNHYFAHTSPTYGNAAAMLTAFGYAYQGVGENIAHHATVEKAEAAFMSSNGHRRNILGSQWTRVGIGICIDKNGFIYATQLFVR